MTLKLAPNPPNPDDPEAEGAEAPKVTEAERVAAADLATRQVQANEIERLEQERWDCEQQIIKLEAENRDLRAEIIKLNAENRAREHEIQMLKETHVKIREVPR